jgi:hypothetical protein
MRQDGLLVLAVEKRWAPPPPNDVEGTLKGSDHLEKV